MCISFSKSGLSQSLADASRGQDESMSMHTSSVDSNTRVHTRAHAHTHAHTHTHTHTRATDADMKLIWPELILVGKSDTFFAAGIVSK